MTWAYYNEHDPKKAAWLRELIKMGLVAPGEVDERSIWDVKPDDLRGFRQCHFFSGIAIWSYALRLAGWEDSRECWSGSAPCQSFSTAGQGAGFADERHLWPAWHHLIRVCRPDTIFGEQVGAAIGFGWLDLVHDDLAAEGYRTGSVVLPACSAGAPHIRSRLWFVADTGRGSICIRDGHDMAAAPAGVPGEAREQGLRTDARDGEPVELVGDSQRPGLEGHGRHGDGSNEPGRINADEARSTAEAGTSYWSDCDWIPCTDRKGRPVGRDIHPLVQRLANAASQRERADEPGGDSGDREQLEGTRQRRDSGDNGATYAQPRTTQPSTGEMADGPAARVGSGGDLLNTAEARVLRLRGYGDGIVAPLAAEFIRAYMAVVTQETNT